MIMGNPKDAQVWALWTVIQPESHSTTESKSKRSGYKVEIAKKLHKVLNLFTESELNTRTFELSIQSNNLPENTKKYLDCLWI